jgi:hypothetical protein
VLTSARAPDFVIVGMPRAGTTFFYHNLQHHPAVHLPWRKELNYLNLHVDRGPTWYADQFNGARPEQRVGDIEPGYFIDPEVPGRLRATAPGVKVVLVLREPVSWVSSLHAHFTRLGDAVPTLMDFALRGWDRRQDGGILLYRFSPRVLDALVDNWARTFGPDLLLVDYAWFAGDRLGALQAFERFLDLPSYFCPGAFDDLRINASCERTLPLLGRLSRTAGVARLAGLPGVCIAARRLRPALNRFMAAPVGASAPAPALPEALISLLEPATRRHRERFAAGPLVHGDGGLLAPVESALADVR